MVFYKKDFSIRLLIIFVLLAALSGCTGAVKKVNKTTPETEPAMEMHEKVIIEKASFFNTSKLTTIIFKKIGRASCRERV